MAKKFLKNKKQIAKDVPGVLARGGVRGVGFFGSKVLRTKGGKLIPEKVQKFIGPALFLVGTAIESSVTNPNLQALGQGIALEGLDGSAREFMPESVKTHMGLEGLGAASGSELTQEELWAQYAREAEAEVAAEQGNDSAYADEDMSGVESDEIPV